MDPVAWKFLLVCLQLIIVLVMSMIVEGMLAVDAPNEPGYPWPRRFSSSASSFQAGFQRAVRLYHKCSNRHVVIKENRVSTIQNVEDMHGNLVLETKVGNDGTIRVQLLGLTSSNYVCYNKRGRVIAKPKGKARGAKCFFSEEQYGGEFRYRSHYNKDWVLGFNPRGQPLKGATVRREDCYRFIKMELSTNSTPSIPDKLTPYEMDVSKHNNKIGHKPQQHRRIMKTEAVPLPLSSSSATSTIPRHKHRHNGHSLRPHRHRNPSAHFRRSSSPSADR